MNLQSRVETLFSDPCQVSIEGDNETQSHAMIVCSCFGTTDREIRAALGPNGTGSCPAGQGCGNCMNAVVDIATEAHQQPATTQRDDRADDAEPRTR